MFESRMDVPYDHRNCQSLFGYAAAVHARSGGVCQLCGCGAGAEINFDLWRQFTVEHLIGQSQKGYLPEIVALVRARFPELPPSVADNLARRIDGANTFSACSFCNSTTSRDRHSRSMEEIIMTAQGGPDELFQEVEEELRRVLKSKRAAVAWKLESVRKAFEEMIEPALRRSRRSGTAS